MAARNCCGRTETEARERSETFFLWEYVGPNYNVLYIAAENLRSCYWAVEELTHGTLTVRKSFIDPDLVTSGITANASGSPPSSDGRQGGFRPVRAVSRRPAARRRHNGPFRRNGSPPSPADAACGGCRNWCPHGKRTPRAAAPVRPHAAETPSPAPALHPAGHRQTVQHDVCAVGEPAPFDSGIGRFAVEHRGTVGDRLPCRGTARQHVRKGIPIRQRTPGGSGGRIRRRKRQHVSVPPPDVPGDIRSAG